MNTTFRRTMYSFIVFVTLATLYLMFDSITDRLTAAEGEREQTDQALAEANSKVTALGDQVRGLGESPVVSTRPVEGEPVKAGPPGLTGPAGPPGPQGLTGRAGAAGAAGAAGVGAVGEPGAKGDSGASGTPGSSGDKGEKGDTGPAGTDGKNGTDGAPGATGPVGPAGSPGRGISGISCTALTPFALTFTFTDGTSEEVACGG